MNVHHLYRGRLARPLPATVLQLGAMTALGLSAGPLSPGGWAAALGGGLLAWSLFEYGLHRVLMHSRIKKLWELLHQEHHQMRQMEDPSHRLLHPLVPVAVFALVTWGGTAPAGLVAGAVGFWMGYLAYEVIHWTHHHPTLAMKLTRYRYFESRLRFHYDHHFRHPRANYGFTSALWDRVFGSYVTPAPLTARRGGARKAEAVIEQPRSAA